MFCPFCGRDFENTGSRYCPFCGQDLASSVTFKERLTWIQMFRVLSPSEGGTQYRAFIITGFVAIAILIAAIALVFVMDDDPSDPVNPGLPSTDIILKIDGSNDIVLSGDFTTGAMNAYINSSKNIMFGLDDTLAEGYDQFIWVLRDEQSNSYSESTKPEPELQWLNPRVGQFTLIVYCYTSDSEDPQASYTGTFTYRGDKDVKYSWSYNGTKFSIESTVSQSDLRKYTSENAAPASARSGKDASLFTMFITEDSTVTDLQKKLSSAYNRQYGSFSAGSYGYADFVLSFVQSIPYAHDSMNYNQSIYWAFPTETLFNNCGDDEDHSILYASIMRAAGYNCGLMVFPNCVLAAVSVSDVPDVTLPDGYTSGIYKRSDKRYAIADTCSTSDSPLGSMRDYYGFDTRGYVTFYGVTYRGDYGLFL